MNRIFRYKAFISYRHTEIDKNIAIKLQKMLENYRRPKSHTSDYKRKWRVFRDETELPSSSDLSEDIKKALSESEFLIVICSHEAKKSRWCLEEIEYFKMLHNGSNSNIITVIAEGEPSEVFPEAVCSEMIAVTDEEGNVSYQNHRIEPLAANVAAPTQKQMMKKLRTEFLRIAAPLLGCGYDALYKRSQRSFIRKFIAVVSAVMAFILAFGLYSSAMLMEIRNQKEKLQLANNSLEKKTYELEESNKDLKKAYSDLSDKTQEAEDNLLEAQKQQKQAEENLEEAKKQQEKAETNLKEANRQKSIAQKNLNEAKRQEKIAKENLAEVTKQKKLVEENAKEAKRQKSTAEKNAKEADAQRKNAEKNAEEADIQRKNAEKNAEEADIQRKNAEKNAEEADIQRKNAEKNAEEAEKERRKVIEVNGQLAEVESTLKEKKAELLVVEAKQDYNDGYVKGAIEKSVEALGMLDDKSNPMRVETYKFLADICRVYKDPGVETGGIEHWDKTDIPEDVISIKLSSAEKNRVIACDVKGNAYLIDYDKGDIIKEYQYKDDVSDIAVGCNKAYFYFGYYAGDGDLICIDLEDGEELWRRKTYINGVGASIRVNPENDIVIVESGTAFGVYDEQGNIIISDNYFLDVDINLYTASYENGIVDDEGNVYIFAKNDTWYSEGERCLIRINKNREIKENYIYLPDWLNIEKIIFDEENLFVANKNEIRTLDGGIEEKYKIAQINKNTLTIEKEETFDNSIYAEFAKPVETIKLDGKFREAYKEIDADCSDVYKFNIYQNNYGKLVADERDDRCAIVTINDCSCIRIKRNIEIPLIKNIITTRESDNYYPYILGNSYGILGVCGMVDAQTISLYDTKTYTLINNISVGFEVSGIEFCDNNTFVVIGQNKEVALYDINGNRINYDDNVLQTMNVKDCCEFKMHKNKIVFFADTCILEVYVGEKNIETKVINSDINPSTISESKDLSMICIVGEDKDGAKKIGYISNGDDRIMYLDDYNDGCAVSDEGTHIAYVNDGKNVRLFNTKTGESRRIPVKKEAGEVQNVVFTPDENYIIVLCKKMGIKYSIVDLRESMCENIEELLYAERVEFIDSNLLFINSQYVFNTDLMKLQADMEVLHWWGYDNNCYDKNLRRFFYINNGELCCIQYLTEDELVAKGREVAALMV